MLYEDMNQVMSPVFKTEDDVTLLQNKILELIILGQGLFPPSEFRLIHHQLYCISKYIDIGGSIKNYWGISGERIMGVIRKCVPQGGSAFDYTAISKYSSYEDSTLHNFYGKECHKSYNITFNTRLNIMLYDTTLDYGSKNSNILIFGLGVNSFLISLVAVIKQKYKTKQDAILNSIYYKLYCKYKEDSILNKKKNISFYEFIAENCNDQQSNEITYYCSLLFNYLNNTIINTFSKATIRGTEFVCKKTTRSNVYDDDLEKNWNNKSNYSSWFKFKDYYNINNISSDNDNSFGSKSWSKFNKNHLYENEKEMYSYGQFNYFFKIENFPDNDINNIIMGCAITRHCFLAIENVSYYLDVIEINNSYRNNLFFISVMDVIPSRILTVGMDKDRRPIKNRINSNLNDIDNYKNYYSKELKPTHLYLLELDEKNKYIMD
jgi:hypothetical protein